MILPAWGISPRAVRARPRRTSRWRHRALSLVGADDGFGAEAVALLERDLGGAGDQDLLSGRLGNADAAVAPVRAVASHLHEQLGQELDGDLAGDGLVGALELRRGPYRDVVLQREAEQRHCAPPRDPPPGRCGQARVASPGKRPAAGKVPSIGVMAGARAGAERHGTGRFAVARRPGLERDDTPVS